MQAILFTRGVPAAESFPVEEIAEATAEALRRHGKLILQYGTSAGLPPLREWLAGLQQVAPEQVILGNGSLQLFEFLCLGWLRKGDVVLTESPTYDRALTLLRRHGIRPVGVPLLADGLDTDALEAAIHAHRPRALYVIPDFQNPSGVTCSLAKRRRIALLAERHQFLIVEDAPYRALRYRGKELDTLRSLAPLRTLHMSSFSKLLGPGPRLGYMVGPPEVVRTLLRTAEDTYICPNNFAHGVAYEWCRAGRLEPQIERLRALYAPRLMACHAAVAKHLPAARATRPDGGFFLSLELRDGVTALAVREAARRYGLEIADGQAFFPSGGGDGFLRLPFCALTPDEIEEGVRRLAASVRDLVPTALSA